MKSTLFNGIREAISFWLKDNTGKLNSAGVSIEILSDDMNCFRVELNFGGILAEILVEEPDFAPYRHVSFQAVGITNDGPELLHYWYDEKNMGVDEIIENLVVAIDVCKVG
jgi:hypothetical protein